VNIEKGSQAFVTSIGASQATLIALRVVASRLTRSEYRIIILVAHRIYDALCILTKPDSADMPFRLIPPFTLLKRGHNIGGASTQNFDRWM
jgi:hypothetical protein